MTAVDIAAGEPSRPLLTPLLERWPERPSGLSTQLNLVRELAVTAFKLKYTGSALGYLWSLAKPLMLFGMMYIVFALFLLRGRTTPLENFPAQLLVGIVVWFYFGEATHAALNAVVSNGDMLRKAFFPRWILVVAAVLSASMTLAVNMLLMLALGLSFHWYHVGWQTLLVIPLLLELSLLATGVGLILAAVYVYYRDLGHIWDVVLQLMFYATAVLFPFRLIPARFQPLIAMNPTAQIIEDVRRALVTPVVPWAERILGPYRAAVPYSLVLAGLLIGVWVFRRLERRFGERL